MKAGDEVITVPNTAVPTVSAIRTLGATPVFVDVRDDDFLMDVEQVEAAITPRTTAIIPVHLYGQCVDLDPLMAIAARHGLKVMEDCAQSQGALYKNHQSGSVGHASSFSFYPTKVLGAYGDGGMVMSDDEAVIRLARSLALLRHGNAVLFRTARLQFASRRSAGCDPVAEAAADRRLDRAPPRHRRALRSRARRQRSACCRARTRTAATPIMSTWSSTRRIATACWSGWRSAASTATFPTAGRSISMRGSADLGYREGQFPVAERKAQRIFSLPMYPHLKDEEVDTVIDVLKDVI